MAAPEVEPDFIPGRWRKKGSRVGTPNVPGTPARQAAGSSGLVTPRSEPEGSAADFVISNPEAAHLAFWERTESQSGYVTSRENTFPAAVEETHQDGPSVESSLFGETAGPGTSGGCGRMNTSNSSNGQLRNAGGTLGIKTSPAMSSSSSGAPREASCTRVGETQVSGTSQVETPWLQDGKSNARFGQDNSSMNINVLDRMARLNESTQTSVDVADVGLVIDESSPTLAGVDSTRLVAQTADSLVPVGGSGLAHGMNNIKEGHQKQAGHSGLQGSWASIGSHARSSGLQESQASMGSQAMSSGLQESQASVGSEGHRRFEDSRASAVPSEVEQAHRRELGASMMHEAVCREETPDDMAPLLSCPASVDSSGARKKQQLLLAGCMILALFIIVGSLSLMFYTTGIPKLPKPKPTLKPRSSMGSSGDELHLTLLNISYSGLVADTALSKRVTDCLQQSIASVAEVLQPNDVHIMLSQALDEPNIGRRSDSSNSSSNINHSVAVLASVQIPSNLSMAAALDNNTKLHLLREQATSGLCFVDGIDEVTTGDLEVVVVVTRHSISTSQATPKSSSGSMSTSQATPKSSSGSMSTSQAAPKTSNLRVTMRAETLVTTTFAAQSLSTSAQLTTAQRSSQAVTTVRMRMLTTPVVPKRPQSWLDRYRLRLHGKGQLLAVQVRLIRGLATGVLEADQMEQLAACLAESLARQVDVAADAIEDLEGRPGTLSVSRIDGPGAPELVADGRIQLPPRLGVPIAAQAVEGAEASSALEDAASRLVALRGTIQAAGGLGTIEIFAGLSRLDRFSRMDRNVNGFLDVREFSEAARFELNPPLARHEIRTVYRMLDANQDGQLDSDEFFARASKRRFIG